MLPHCEDVVAQVSNPKVAKLIILRLRLFWESGDEGSTCNASSITYRPALVFETIDQRFEQGWDVLAEWLFLLIIDCDLVANFADTMTGRLSHGMVVSE